MSALAGEIAKLPEVIKPPKVIEKNPISSKFKQAKAKLTSFSTGIKQAFSNLSKGSSQVIFNAEKNELDKLTDKLSQLNQETATVLGTSLNETEDNSVTSQAEPEKTSVLTSTKTKENGPTERNLKKTGDKKGTNEGGFYMDEKSGEVFYVKFYTDMNQGRMEVIANQIYQKLGIPAPESEILIINGKQAFASKVVEGHQRLPQKSLSNDKDICSGFVADAFLANWDVVGLVYDNIEKGADGKKYRIDNGGTFLYRAQGGPKDYSPDSIGELDTLRNPNVNAQSASVFSTLSESEMKGQAKNLVDNLTDTNIDLLVDQSGLSEDIANTLRIGMKGRRGFLIKRFDLEQESKPPSYHRRAERAQGALQKLQERMKTTHVEKMFATSGLLGDSDKIEGHQIDFIQQDDRTVVTFKMTSSMTEKVKSEVIPSLQELTEGTYNFQSTDGETSNQGKCWTITVDENTVIYVSKGEKKGIIDYTYDVTKPIKDEQGNIINYEATGTERPGVPIRSLMGAVKIEVQGLTDAQQISEKVDTAFQKLKITEALVTPDQQAENQYKEARYRWQHKLTDDKEWQTARTKYKEEHGTELIDSLKAEEVFPGYSTIVDPGASERYQRDGKIYLFHHIHDANHITAILKNGLFASYERYKRGMFTNGMSTEMDFASGGADSVFIRAIPQSAADYDMHFYDAHLLINPQVLDRTDWYAYNTDAYGTTDSPIYSERPTPESFFASQKEYFNSSNEIMMRRGIPPEMISGIVIGDNASKTQLITILQEAGIQEVNGIPLDKYIVVAPNFGDLKKTDGITTSAPDIPQEAIPEVNASQGDQSDQQEHLDTKPYDDSDLMSKLNKYTDTSEFKENLSDSLHTKELFKSVNMEETSKIFKSILPKMEKISI